jgi:hypothetical protein
MKERKRFSDKASFVTGDLGNQFLKLMLAGVRTEMTAIRNSVVAFNESEWNVLRERYQYTRDRYANTFLFSFRGRDNPNRSYYVVVGDHAAQFGQQFKLSGEVKYNYDAYWGAILCSQLLTLFPEGHNHVVMALAHPTRSVGQRDIMGASSVGKHFVTLPSGDEVSFTVREVVPWDEPVGGLVRWGESLDAVYNSRDLRRGSKVMVLDIGGGITSFTDVFIDRDRNDRIIFNPIYDETISPSIDIGIQSVMDRLRAELLKNVPQFRGMKRLSNDMLEGGIRDGVICISGDPVDVSVSVRLAQSQLIDSIVGVYQNSMQGGRPYAAIICTGGGMSSMFDILKKEVLNHKYVFPATGNSLSDIHFANLQGGDEIFRQWLKRQRDEYGA